MERIGSQEPTTSFILPYQETDGQTAVDLYEMTGRSAMEWQKALIYDILAKGPDGRWVHSRFGYAVPRRNGKGEVVVMRELYGLATGEKILHTAHLTSTSHNGWERTKELLDKLGMKGQYTAIKAKGQEEIRLQNGGEIHFRTRTETGALGEGFDLVIIDEAQEYQARHQTALRYVVTASRNPQTIMLGTPPTAVSSGTVFKDYRKAVLAGETTNAGWAEWSVPEISDVNDRELWYETNPSLGLTLAERNIVDEIGTTEDERLDFNIQRLGLWLKYSQKSAISRKAWETVRLDKMPQLTGKISVGIKYNVDGMTVTVAVAAKMADSGAFVEVYGRKPVREGTGWILAFLSAIRKSTGYIVIDGKNGSELLKKDMADAKLKIPIVASTGMVIEANQGFETAIYKGELKHMEQPSLTQVISNCEHRAIGTNGGFGYKAQQKDADITLLEATALAHWGAVNFKEVRQRVSF